MYQNFELRAINTTNLQSDPSCHHDIQTKSPTYLYRLQKEMERVELCSDTFIDADFLQGTMQRENRYEYLQILKKKMEQLNDLPKAKDNDDHQSSVSSSTIERSPNQCENENENENENNNIFDFHLQRRRSQFCFRINALQHDIVHAKKAIENININRTFLSFQMNSTQERLISITRELDRISTYHRQQIISNVMHGSKQRFYTKDLKKQLQDEYEQSHLQIAKWKADVIEGEQAKNKWNKTIEQSESRLKERCAALLRFDHQQKQVEALQKKISRTSMERKKESFFLLRKNKNTRKLVRKRLQLALNGHEQLISQNVFRKWRYLSEIPSDIIYEEEPSGAGDVRLRKTFASCSKNIEFNSSLLVTISNVEHTMLNVDFSLEEKTMLTQGDIYFKCDQYDKALSYYQTLIESNPSIRHKKSISRTIMLHGKMGDVLEKLGKWERAIMHYETQLELNKIDKSNIYTAQAYTGIGYCYVGRCEYSNAIHYFSEATNFCSTHEGKHYYLKVCLGLKQCEENLKLNDNAKKRMQEYESITNEIQNKITCGIAKVTKLNERLVNITADIGKIITLENVTARFVEIKRNKESIQNKISSTEIELSICQNDQNKTRKMIDIINKELNNALDSKEEKMMSALVHQNMQKLETGELIIRLQEKAEVFETLFHEKKMKVSQLKANIQNYHTDIRDLEEEMEVENGPLMQRVLSKGRFIRCVGLNTSNSRENDVIGELDSGRQYVVSSDGSDIFVHHIQKGYLHMVFKGHVEIPNHKKSIMTCLHFHNTQIYAGSMDNTIMCWDINKEELLYVGKGHDASVTCIYVDDWKIVTGSADKKIGIWNKDSGHLIRLVPGHNKGILSIQSGSNWCVSGGSDGIIFIWESQDHISDSMYKNVRDNFLCLIFLCV